MTHRIRRPFGLVLLLVAALMLFGMVTAAAASADPVDVKGDVTRVTVNPVVIQTLADAGIVVMPINPAKVYPTRVDNVCTSIFDFPVTEGMIAPDTLAGVIWHSGGLTLMQPSTGATLQVRNFRIETDGTADGWLYALAGDQYIPLLHLDLSAPNVGGVFPLVKVGNVVAHLTPEAAGAINATFFGGAATIPDGLEFGVAKVTLRLPKYGHTEVYIDPTILDVLTDAKLQILPIWRASVMPALEAEPWEGILGPTLAYRFPITDRDLTGKKQAIWHGGGLRPVNLDACTWASFTKFRIDPVKQRLYACYCGVMWVKLFNLDFTDVVPGTQGPYSVLSPVGLDLTYKAAKLLNQRLGVAAFEGGMRVGYARVVVR
jgi:hypothetical protein